MAGSMSLLYAILAPKAITSEWGLLSCAVLVTSIYGLFVVIFSLIPKYDLTWIVPALYVIEAFNPWTGPGDVEGFAHATLWFLAAPVAIIRDYFCMSGLSRAHCIIDIILTTTILFYYLVGLQKLMEYALNKVFTYEVVKNMKPLKFALIIALIPYVIWAGELLILCYQKKNVEATIIKSDYYTVPGYSYSWMQCSYSVEGKTYERRIIGIKGNVNEEITIYVSPKFPYIADYAWDE